MFENHRDKIGSKLKATESILWLPPSYIKNGTSVSSEQELTPKMSEKDGGTKWGFSDKSAWEWLLFLATLLGALAAIAVPFVVTVLGLNISQQIMQQQVQASERQHQTDLQIAELQQQATTLNICIDDIKDLLLNHNLRKSKPGDEASIVARAETLLTLRQLDGEGKRALLLFLSEANLITTPDASDPIISLNDAALSGVDLSGLFGPNLSSADLDHADLSGANLSGTELLFANLIYADLRGANLNSANLHSADLVHADLVHADLRGADLNGADLGAADLRGADLRSADLGAADLSDADLRGASVTQGQLASARSLKDAIMPDGSKHP